MKFGSIRIKLISQTDIIFVEPKNQNQIENQKYI